MVLNSFLQKICATITAGLFVAGLLYVATVHGQTNPQINYQGKLTDSTGLAVADGSYNMRFYLYNTTGGATTSAIWTEALTGTERVSVINGLFSVMLGSTSALTAVDFNQTLYLGVEVGGSGVTPSWDGEMSPRKILGTVPAAFEARQLEGLPSASFLRSDDPDTMSSSSATTLLTLSQQGTGGILDVRNPSGDSALQVLNSGTVVIGTSSTNFASSSLVVEGKTDVLHGEVSYIASYDPGNTSIHGGGESVIVVGDYMYVGSKDGDNVTIVNVADPSRPTTTGSFDPGGDILLNPESIQVRGDYLYVVGSRDNLVIADISDPANPVYIGEWDPGDSSVMDNPRDLDIYGNYAYIAGGGNADTLAIVNITDPTNPTLTGLWDPGTSVANELQGVTVKGDYAYVTGSSQPDFAVVDVSDPANPTTTVQISTAISSSEEMVIIGNTAYVAGLYSGLTAIDISDPTDPLELDTLRPSDLTFIVGLDIVGDYAYLIGETSDNLYVLDISSSTNFVAVDNWSNISLLEGPQGVAVRGNNVYVTSRDTDTVAIFDAGGFTAPTAEIGDLLANDVETSYLRVTQQLFVDRSLNVGGSALINGNLALAGSLFDGTATSGVSGYVLQSTGTSTVWVSTSSLNIAGGGGGSSLFTDGGAVTYLTSLTDYLAIGSTTAYDNATFTTWGDFAVASSATEALLAADLASSTVFVDGALDVNAVLPKVLSVWSTSTSIDGEPQGHDVQGDYVYVTGNVDDNLAIVDVSDPNNPRAVGNWDPGASVIENPRAVDVVGDYAYVIGQGSTDNLVIVDVSNPSAPTTTGNWDPNDTSILDNPIDVHVAGGYAYVLDANNKDVVVIDVSEPASPILAAAWRPNDNSIINLPSNFAIRGDLMFITSEITDGLVIVDISNPLNPVTRGVWDENNATVMDKPQGLAFYGNYALITGEDSDTVAVVDITDPDVPSLTSTFNPGATILEEPVAITVAGHYAYISEEFSAEGANLIVMDISDPAAPTFVARQETNVNDSTPDLIVRGNELFLTNKSAGMPLVIFDIGGAEASTAEIGDLLATKIETEYLSVTTQLLVDGSVDIAENVSVGGSALINGNLALAGSLFDGTATSGVSGYVLQSTGTSTVWVSTSSLNIAGGGGGSSLFTDGGAVTYLTSLTDYLAIGSTTAYDNATFTTWGDFAVASSATEAVFVVDLSSSTVTVDGSLDVQQGSVRGIGSIIDGANGADELQGAGSITTVGNYMYVASYFDDGVQILDISDPTNPTGVGSITDGANGADILNGPTGIIVVGNYAYVSSFFDNGVQILDISDPTNPTGVGSITDGANGADELEGANSLEIVGQYAYIVGQADDGVQILDISDPTNPTGVGSITDGANGADELDGAASVTIAGSYAYVTGADDNGVQILDISDPTNPTGVGSITDGANGADELEGAHGITVAGNYAYVTGLNDDGVQILDISDPTNPTGVGSITDGANGADELDGAISVTVIGNYAFVTGREDDGVQILNISSSTNPTGVDSITDGTNGVDELNGPNGIVITGNYAYVSSYLDHSVEVLDLGGFTTPTAEIGDLFSSDIQTKYLRVSRQLIVDDSVNIAGNTLIGGNLALAGTFEVSGKTSVLHGDLVHRGSIADGGSLRLFGTQQSAAVGDYLYVAAAEDNGVQILDISNPNNPVGVGNISDGVNGANNLQGAFSVAVAGNHLYVISRNDGMQILNIADPTNPVAVGAIADESNGADTLARATEAEIVGQYAYVVAQDDDGLQVIDISDPANPVGVGSITDGASGADRLNGANGIAVQGSYAYVASVFDGFQVIDISDPTNPIGVGSIADGESGANTLDTAEDVVVDGNYAYVIASNDDGVQIIDISDPTDPTGVGSITDGNNGADALDRARSIDKAGDYLYVGGYNDDAVQVIDVSSTTNPVGVGSISSTTGALLEEIVALTIHGNYLYTSSEAASAVQVIDLGGFRAPSAEIGILLADTIETAYLRTSQLIADDGLNVGTDAMIGGTLSITGTASSSLLATNNATALEVTSGDLVMGDGTTNATSSIHVGYGGICVDNDGTCDATTTGRITGVELLTGNSDLAETYFSTSSLEAGEIVSLTGSLTIGRATPGASSTIIGVVSTKPGLLLGFDDTVQAGAGSYPIALSGRVPVKISTENGPVKRGDALMLSSLPGVAMKASSSGTVVGIALEDFDDERMYSNTFVNQYTDDIPDFATTTLPGENDPLSKDELIEELADVPSETVELSNNTDVQLGQIVMFVSLQERPLADFEISSLRTLLTEMETTIVEEESLFETIWRIAASFDDVIGNLVNRITVTETRITELETKVQALESIIQNLPQDASVGQSTTDTDASVDTSPDEQTDPAPGTSTSTASSTESVVEEGSDAGTTPVDTASSTEPAAVEEEGSDGTPEEEVEAVEIVEELPEETVSEGEEILLETTSE